MKGEIIPAKHYCHNIKGYAFQKLFPQLNRQLNNINQQLLKSFVTETIHTDVRVSFAIYGKPTKLSCMRSASEI